MSERDHNLQDNGSYTTGAVLTRHTEAVPAAMGPVITMELVQRYVESERNRHRRILLWTSALSVFVILLVLVLFVSIGIFVLSNARRAAEIAEGVEDRTEAVATEVTGVSSKVGELVSTQQHVKQKLEADDTQRKEERVMLQSDLRRFSQWVSTSQSRDDEAFKAMEYRLRQMESSLATRDRELVALQERYTALQAATVSLGRAAAPTNLELAVTAPSLPSTTQSSGTNLPPISVPAVPAPAQDRETNTVSFPNGDRYEGEFEDGLFNGYGVYAFGNGDRYEGYFEQDVMHGTGAMVYANGNRYTGEWRMGKRNGIGELRLANGDVYTGTFADDQRTGQGTYAFKGGARYVGEFLNGVRHGNGCYRYPTGDEYRGYFKDGKRDGAGVCTFANGQQVQGLWKDDQLAERVEGE